MSAWRSNVSSSLCCPTCIWVRKYWLNSSPVTARPPICAVMPGSMVICGTGVFWKALRTTTYISISSNTPAIRNIPPYSRVRRIRMVGRNGSQLSPSSGWYGPTCRAAGRGGWSGRGGTVSELPEGPPVVGGVVMSFVPLEVAGWVGIRSGSRSRAR